jgi:NADP-dependent 3-hydroxy acid dehydrogenase YdfG
MNTIQNAKANNMKLAITGTSRGLGKFLKKCYEVIYDVVEPSSRIQQVNELVEEIKDCDVFINNAHDGFCQTELLYAMFEEWKHDERKLIINIGSRAAKPNISKGYLYAAQKASLSHLTDNLVYNNPDKKCRISTIDFGMLERKSCDIPFLEHVDASMYIDTILFAPDHIEIPNLTVHHRANYTEIQKLKE